MKGAPFKKADVQFVPLCHSIPLTKTKNTQDITKGVDKAIDAAEAWNKTTLVDAALRTSVSRPCKTGYLADGKLCALLCGIDLSERCGYF